ncbi:RHS repeat domain-containing protein [Chitinophaga sp. Hz27]|uniref:RHS repeat domain-containing protein n=1 Tax=Chitinophaga sp. Hz27 TaxID=3347169 RepID=UPI0035D9605C
MHDYYPFGSLMPNRGGNLDDAGNWNVNTGMQIPVDLVVNSRTGNQPGVYNASSSITFDDGFESGEADTFDAWVVAADGGSGNGSGSGGTVTAGGYRYGFNGKENDNEVKGEGNQQDYGFRIYDPRIAKFLSVDPLIQSYPWYTPYQFAGNKPIVAIDLDGLEEYIVHQYFNQNKVSKIEIVRFADVNGNVQDNRMTRLADGYEIRRKVLVFNHRNGSDVSEVVEQDQLTKVQQSVLDKNLSIRNFSHKNGGFESFSSAEYSGERFTEGSFAKSWGEISYPKPVPHPPRPVTISGFKGSNNYYLGVSNFPGAGELGDELKGALLKLGKSIDKAGNYKLVTVSLLHVVGADLTTTELNEAQRQANVVLDNIIKTLKKDTKSKVKIIGGGAKVVKSNETANKVKDAGTNIKLE